MRKSWISQYKQKRLQELFVAGATVRTVADFGGKCKGKRGRGSAGKVPVFGFIKRGGKVYTRLIPNAKSDTLMPIITAKIKPDSLVYTDNFARYDGLGVSENTIESTIARSL